MMDECLVRVLAMSVFAGEWDLISRGQAKTIATDFLNAGEMRLDFSGVDDIGRAFADELFRVWLREHPEVRFVVINASIYVKKMISHVIYRKDLPQADSNQLVL
ncbi:MAG: STAS-like domain-containing protein [Thiobacillus sp.]